MLIETVFATSESSLFTEKMDFWEFILLAISLIVLVAGIFSIVYILWWGLLLILSGGKDEKIKPAINSIRYALIGLIIVVLSIFVFPRLAGLLGLEVSSYSSPDKIFDQIRIIGDKIFGWGSNMDYNSSSDIDSLPSDFSDL